MVVWPWCECDVVNDHITLTSSVYTNMLFQRMNISIKLFHALFLKIEKHKKEQVTLWFSSTVVWTNDQTSVFLAFITYAMLNHDLSGGTDFETKLELNKLEVTFLID